MVLYLQKGSLMKSVISYPDRGNWGSNAWRGNLSGYVMVDLINHFKPKLVVDVCEGSGTSGDVCRDMGVEYVGLDLHKGNDFTKDSVLKRLSRPADLVFSHPPYHNMIQYSGNMYGSALSEDTSRCRSVDEFLAMSEVMLLNQREATREGGVYSSLIGDMRKNGMFRSFQADFINMMPKDELISVTIKIQHNCVSNNRNYSNSFIPILHEYLLVWKKSAATLFAITYQKAVDLTRQVATSWRNAIRLVLMELGSEVSLTEIYNEVERVAGNLIKNNKNWKAKVRQKLQQHHTHVKRGVWSI